MDEIPALPEGFTLDQGTPDLPPGFTMDTPEQAAPVQEAPQVPENQQAFVGDYRSTITSMLNDPRATTDQIVGFMRQFGVEPPAETMAALRNREETLATYGTYHGQAVINEQAPQDIEQVRPQQDVSTLDALGTGLYQGATLGFGDEIAAGIGAAGNSIAGLVGAGTGESYGDYYERQRDQNRAYLDDAENQHAYAYNGGQVAGGVATAFIPGGGLNLLGRAALEGGIYGAGDSEASTAVGVGTDALLGAGLGGATAGALNGLGSAVSPIVAPHVKRLLDAGVRLTPGQLIGSRGGVGLVARDGEEVLKSLPFVGSMVERRQAESVGDLNRHVVEEASGYILNRKWRPEEYALRGRKQVEKAERNALDMAQLRRADDGSRNLATIEGVSGLNTGTASPQDLLLAATQGGADTPLLRAARDGADVMGSSTVGRVGGYLDNLLGPTAKYLARGAVGAAGALHGGPAAIAGAVGTGLAYTKSGNAAIRSALAGRQGQGWQATRRGIEQIGPKIDIAAPIYGPYTEE